MNTQNNGRIDSVTLYSDRAYVTRIAEVEFDAKDNTLTIADLPTGIVDSSIRVSAHGSAPITIYNVNICFVAHEKEPSEKIRELQESINGINREIKAFELKITERRKQVEFVDKLVKSKADASGKDLLGSGRASVPTADELGEILDFVYIKRVEAEQAQLDLSKDLEIARDKLGKLQFELGKHRGVSKRTKTIIVDFAGKESGKAEFKLDYVIANAFWRPYYNIRASANDDSVAVSYMAMVRQSTGEDWDDVSLKLSTATPRLGAKAPKVDPWRVDFREEQFVMGAVQAGAPIGGEMIVDFDEVEVEPMAAEALDDMGYGAEAAVSSVDSSGVSATFEIKRRESVINGGAR